MPIRKKVNEDFFKKWSPEMAYIFGFFMADGSLDVNPRGSQYLSFHICDFDLLRQIRKCLKSNHKITLRPQIEDQKKRYRLQIGRKVMYEDLKKLGVSESKTFGLVFPDIPDKYFSHFLRGYFDGDGNVWTGVIHKKRKKRMHSIQTVFTSGSNSFLESLQAKLKKLGMGKGSFFFSRGAYRLQYSIKDSILLSQIMYSQVTQGLILERKYKIFDKYIKSKGLSFISKNSKRGRSSVG